MKYVSTTKNVKIVSIPKRSQGANVDECEMAAAKLL